MDSVENIIIGQSKFKKFKKNELLLHDGHVSRSLFFIKKGITRHYILNEDGKELTNNFTLQGTFVIGSISSFLTQKKARVRLQALTDIECYELDYRTYNTLLKNDEFIHFWNRLLCGYIIKKEKKEISFLNENAKNRYLRFLKNFPNLINEIPHYYIASYLRISSETLSRIRRNLSK